MGSIDSEHKHRGRSYTVLVTGFGPFFENQINPSCLIAESLPARLALPDIGEIDIHCATTPIEVSYRAIRELFPRLLTAQNVFKSTTNESLMFDLVLNIGLAANHQFYTMETRAHRDGYVRQDVRGETMENDVLWKDELHAPEILESTLDTVDVWRRWKSALVDEDLRPSDDAGNFCCDFMYYTSMVEYWQRDHNGQRPCMFLHVPSGHTAEDVARGRRVALGLITALIGSQLMKGKI